VQKFTNVLIPLVDCNFNFNRSATLRIIIINIFV